MGLEEIGEICTYFSEVLLMTPIEKMFFQRALSEIETACYTEAPYNEIKDKVRNILYAVDAS